MINIGPKCNRGCCEHAIFFEEYRRVDALHMTVVRNRIERLEAVAKAAERYVRGRA